MKLSLKIFLGICIPAIIAIFIISTVVININYQRAIESEKRISIKDVENIEENIDRNITVNKIEIIKAIATMYKKDEIDLSYYENNEPKFYNEEKFICNNEDLLNVEDGKYNVMLKLISNNHYLLVSTKIDENQTIIYTKNINSIYNERNNLIKNCLYIFFALIIGIAFIAYVISRTLTKPLNKMKKEMVNLAKGNYDIHLKEGNNEIGELAKNFNEMSRELKKRNDELIELANSKQLFIDNLSHEMNTPLTSIQGYAELMEKVNLSEEQKNKYLKYIQDESKRIQDMYKKLLLISYKKKSDFKKSNVNMDVVLQEVLNIVKSQLNELNINLFINNQLEFILGDETLIIMGILNLVKNAINVSKSGDIITINTFEINEKNYIEVVDQGTGISKEDIDKITEPFYRVDKVRSRKNGGAGLGLSICKSIMELHGGKLKISSKLGVGSKFILEFPQK